MESGKDNRRIVGREGEDMACRMLEGVGHRILERNWRSGHLEIDIISHAPDGIHFVEVKTRRSNVQAPPQFNVDAGKQRRITKAAQSYLRTADGRMFKGCECFFDVVAITYKDGDAGMEYFENAYIPIYL